VALRAFDDKNRRKTMTIEERRNGTKVVLLIGGSLDTTTAPDLEKELNSLKRTLTTEIVLDFSKLTAISSMGLRVILQTQKNLSAKKGKLIIKNLSPLVREVFEMTGLIDLFVQDEGLVIVQKEKNTTMADLALSGYIESGTVPVLEKNLYQMLLEEPKLTTISLDLSGISSASAEGLDMLQDMQKRIQGRGKTTISLENIPEHIKI
jgi:anti-sigma B factor antagonist